MERVIRFAEYEIPMKATAATLARYRSAYNRDLLVDFKSLQNAAEKGQITSAVIDIFVRLAHTMARQADPDIEPDPFEWVDRFEVFPIQEILIPIMSLWADSLGVRVEVRDDGKKNENQPGQTQPG